MFAQEDGGNAGDDSAIEDPAVASEINALNEEIANRKANIDEINRRIESYRKQIDSRQTQSLTLVNEIELLGNRIAKTELDIEATREEISAVNAEILVFDKQIQEFERRLETDRAILVEILRKIDVYDNDLTLQLLFGTDSFSELFDRLQELENVNADLHGALDRAKSAKDRVTLARTAKEGKKARLSELETSLSAKKAQFEGEVAAKESLLSETQQSEAQFAALLYELRQEEAYISHQIAVLQGEIESKIVESDSIGDSSILSWPVDPGYRGLSTTFHDPTYPFRHLFEHSGIDIPAPQGTPVASAAPGYVAWVRTGRSYGNYVMIIHTNGIATLYAHMSKMTVKPDQFVARGDIIGLSGGRPGSAGAGLSTGPHMHFEVRKNGIPTDPLDYLIGGL